tara:strand:- start:6048 stop:6332 length:285 start_codon:yes stop_codon:yes gene_type:complete
MSPPSEEDNIILDTERPACYYVVEGGAMECPVDIRIGDLVRPRVAYLRDSVGVVVDVYKLTHEESGESWWVGKAHINNEIHVFPVQDVDLIKRG